MILTSPSLLVEGVRSGSRRRNAATASPLVERGAEPHHTTPVPHIRVRRVIWPVYGGCTGNEFVKLAVAQGAAAALVLRTIQM